MSKTSSYQKLKTRNRELIQDIHDLVHGKDAIKEFSVRVKWKMKFQLEDFAWSGSATNTNA